MATKRYEWEGGVLADPETVGEFPGEVKFTPGWVHVSRSAMKTLDPTEVLAAMERHLRGDWGDLCDDSKATNDRCLAEGGQIISAYYDRHGNLFWIATVADRSATFISLA